LQPVEQAYLLSTTGRLLACPLLPPHLQPVQIASLRDLASALAHLSPDMCVFYLITPEDMSARIVLYGAWHTLISDIVWLAWHDDRARRLRSLHHYQPHLTYPDRWMGDLPALSHASSREARKTLAVPHRDYWISNLLYTWAKFI